MVFDRGGESHLRLFKFCKNVNARDTPGHRGKWAAFKRLVNPLEAARNHGS
jgi:hypothetical protein